ncbi:MAG TPA: MATE family efflux transporter [Bacteroidia bacterium]|jgi:O-antigen/teichoic acid export membrane protein|nr:MATE family efflux transporter [Bacteroidia bacterium]
MELIHKIKEFNLKTYFTVGHSRSVKTKKNILASVLIKGVSVLTSFILVPLTINYLTPVNYGIWLTLYSIISWFGLLDIGLGNGLRNKFAESVASGDKNAARTYLSTAYVMLGMIMGVACVLFLIINHYLNWAEILNVSEEKAIELTRVTTIIFSSFCLQLVVKLISAVLLADQKTAISGALNTVSSILSLLVIFILTKTTQGSLIYMAITIGVINVIVPFIASAWFYKTYYKDYAPSFKFVDFRYGKKLMTVGVMFFLFQSTALIVVATDNIIITRMFGAEEVTPYNIALKYFTPITLVFTIISAPLWSAYTESFAKKDIEWIKRITGKMVRIWFLMVLAVVPMILLSGFAYELWVGKEIKISTRLTIWMALYTLLASWNQIFGNFINGVGKFRVGFYISIFTAIINIPLCIVLAKYTNWGVSAIIAASCISLVPDIVLMPIQYLKIIRNKATGIWDK